MTSIQNDFRSVVSLDGEWDFFPDKNNLGVKHEWFKKPIQLINEIAFSKIKVPACWEEFFPGYDGIGWYMREFDSPKGAEVVHLHFGAVNYFAEVWVNGWYIGSHEGGYSPFSFDVTRFLNKAEKNALYVRVIDPGKVRVEGMVLSEVPGGKETWLYNFGGIWQSVSLLSTGNIWIDNCFVDAAPEPKLVNFKIFIKNYRFYSGVINASVEIYPLADKKNILINHPFEIYITPGDNIFNLSIDSTGLDLWTLVNPVLYGVRIRINKDESVLDEVCDKFGIRSFTVKDKNFYLNGEKIILKSILTQGFYAAHLAYPDSKDAARKELEYLKAAGFNMLRLHIKTTPEVTLDLADEMGVLIYEEAPNGWMNETSYMQKRCLNEVREMIERDYNHPSIVIWGMMNEHYDKLNIRHQLSSYAHFVDSTRLIIDDSGGWTGSTLNYLPGKKEPMASADVHRYLRYPVDEEIFGFFTKIGRDKDFAFVSEYGFGGMQDLESVVEGFKERGLNEDLEDYVHARSFLMEMRQNYKKWSMESIFSSLKELCLETQYVEAAGNKIQTEALRLNPNVSGYSMTALSAAGWEQHGLIDVWQQPRPQIKTLALAQQPLLPVFGSIKHNYWQNEVINLPCNIINENVMEGDVELSLYVKPDKTGTDICVGMEKVSLKKGVFISAPVLFSYISEVRGLLSFRLVVRFKGSIIAENTTTREVFPRRDWNSVRGVKLVYDQSAIDTFLKNNAPQYKEKAEKGIWVIDRLDDDWLETVSVEELDAIRFSTENGDRVVILSMGEKINSTKVKRLIPLFDEANHKLVHSEGSFIGVFHWIKENSYFQGLPINCLAHQTYQNILPSYSIENMPPEHVPAGCFRSFDITTHQWWAADLVDIPMGKGRIILSQYRLVQNIGKDPAADILLANLLNINEKL